MKSIMERLGYQKMPDPVAYKEKLEEYKERRKEILRLRETMTLQEIGDIYGVSRQRVHQIINEP